jgi:hypothetical protein
MGVGEGIIANRIPAFTLRQGFVINRGSHCKNLGFAELSCLAERVEK